jgi:oxygen-dependent protoporphyrinogen oxidase
VSDPADFVPARRVVVVGGGIAGLTAAYRLATTAPAGTAVTLLEASPTLGGKLRTTALAGLPVDEGAESLLARVPEALDLATEVGLAPEVVYPATTKAWLWTRGALRPVPSGTVMGVPADLRALDRSGVLSAAGSLRVPLDVLLPRTPIGDDVAVGWYVGQRLGREVVERLVDPLLGGVYAGRAADLSLAATVPALAEAARRHRSLVAAARAAAPRATAPGATEPRDRGGEPVPVFAAVRGGLGRLCDAVAVAATAAGAELRTRATARELIRRSGGGWLVEIGPAGRSERLVADAVVVAVPARPAARLLAKVAPVAARELDGIDYASMALVTLAFTAESLRVPAGSGFLVPAVDGRLVKAVTFLSAKWPWLRDAAPGLEVVRCSVGRYGDTAAVRRDDRDLVTACAAELAEAVGARGRVVASRVSRWGGGLPQYAVGHRARVERIRTTLAVDPSLAVCGAAYDGVGVPACIRTAEAAVERVLPTLRR